MKKLFGSIFMIFIMLVALTGCGKSLSDYNEYYVELDSTAQKNIEDLYKEKYNIELKWCMPECVYSFETVEELRSYAKSHSGIRPYGKTSDSYILCEYSYERITADYYSLYYKELLLLDGDVLFGNSLSKILIYKDNKLIEVNSPFDISSYLGITEEEALEIKINNTKYNKNYFEIFMGINDESLETVYDRLLNDLSK